MKIIQLPILAMAISCHALLAQEPPQGPALELPKITVVPIQDSGAGRPYELYIKVPEGYADSTHKQYPVIFYTDAMWHVEMLSGSTEYMMEESILVGISWQKDLTLDVGAHVSRYRDYSIRESSNADHQAKYQFGQAESHLNFIRKDVIPFIEENYRVNANQHTYFGYSLGGEFGAYVLLTEPDTFKNYILGSPSLRGEIPWLTEASAARSGEKLNANVFISYGSLEEELGNHADQFIAVLRNRNDESLSLKHVVIDGTHSSAFPATAVRAVKWLANSGEGEE